MKFRIGSRRPFPAVTIALIVLFIASATSTAHAGAAVTQKNTDGGAYDYQGAYINGSISIGRIDFDGGIDSDGSGGFGLGAGYRALPWLAIEGHFQLLGGQSNADLGAVDRDSLFWGFTVGPKVYPLGLFEAEGVPDNFQPYGLIGIGGGEFDIDRIDEESSFIARFILGFDYYVDEHVGFFVEGGGFAAEEDDVDGVGVFSVGVNYRF